MGGSNKNCLWRSGDAEETLLRDKIKESSLSYITSSSVAPSPSETIICDTGASNTYFKPNHKQYLQTCFKIHNGPQASLPDNTTIKASHQGTLLLHPKVKINALIFPKLTNESLLSIGQLCDLNCTATFDKEKWASLKIINLSFKAYEIERMDYGN